MTEGIRKRNKGRRWELEEYRTMSEICEMNIKAGELMVTLLKVLDTMHRIEERGEFRLNSKTK